MEKYKHLGLLYLSHLGPTSYSLDFYILSPLSTIRSGGWLLPELLTPLHIPLWLLES